MCIWYTPVQRLTFYNACANPESTFTKEEWHLLGHLFNSSAPAMDWEESAHAIYKSIVISSHLLGLVTTFIVALLVKYKERQISSPGIHQPNYSRQDFCILVFALPDPDCTCTLHRVPTVQRSFETYEFYNFFHIWGQIP